MRNSDIIQESLRELEVGETFTYVKPPTTPRTEYGKPPEQLIRPRDPNKIVDRPNVRDLSPTPRGKLGGPPEYMSEKVRAAWEEIVARAHRGTLSDSDQFIVEELAHLIVRCRESDFNVPQSILYRYERCLTYLGLNPISRNKVKVDTAIVDDNAYAKFKKQVS